jgi:type IX secretion system PorP/SprF family membrane protein
MKNLCFLFLLLPVGLLAQQLPNTPGFSSGSFAWNPGMTAPWSYIESQAIYQQEWFGFEGAPQTLSASFQLPLIGQNMSLGTQLTQDKVGPLKQSSIALMYAYQLKLSYHDRLAVGVVVNMSQFDFDGSDLLAFDLDDTSLGFGEGTEPQLNFGLGIYYTSVNTEEWDESHFFAGLSVMQALPGDLYFKEVSSTANFDRSVHGYGQFGYRSIQGYGFFEPSLQILFATPNIAHFQLDVKYEMFDAFWAGLSLDSAFRAGLQLGFIIPGVGDGSLRIGTRGSYNLSGKGAEQGVSLQALVGYRYEI